MEPATELSETPSLSPPLVNRSSENALPAPSHRIAPELACALARAQGQFPPIRKAHEATVQTRTGGSYRYTFADLAAVIEAVRPALAKHELALVQLPRVRLVDGAAFVGCETILAHASGAWIATELELPVDAATPQAIGSGLTYARRYSILALLGVAAEDEDDDGAGSSPRPSSGSSAEPAPSSRSRKVEGGKSVSTDLASPNQIKLMWARAKARAREHVAEGDAAAEKELGEEVLRAALPAGVTSSKEITSRQVDGVLERIGAWMLPEGS